ncbi:MAG: NUDIX domain-containing protein [Deltaproteobacteria bacterium]|nr:NUDIX domain-containing protein [Deltaproteobacteria bacterium]MBI3293213.1 NUDIX domain-containing protein [Deltaproteobacteria bacterium]
MKPLPLEDFKAVVRNTPLFSIDFLLLDPHNRVLLGRRKNGPAAGCLLPPGGRIFKNEPMKDAIRRISRSELGFEITLAELSFLGLVEVMYPDNVFDEAGFGTHYISAGFSVPYAENSPPLTDPQHSEFVFLSITDAMNHPEVHNFSKAFLAALHRDTKPSAGLLEY